MALALPALNIPFLGCQHISLLLPFAQGYFAYAFVVPFNDYPCSLTLVSFASAQLVVTLTLALCTNRWTVFHHCFIWGSLVAWWVFVGYMYSLPMMIYGFESFYGT